MTRTRRQVARWAVATIMSTGLLIPGLVAPATAAPVARAAANPDVTGSEWTTPAAVKVGQTPARAVVVPFDTVDQARANPTLHQAEQESPNVRNLDGTWKFHYVPRPADRPQVSGVTEIPDGYQDIEVPSSWEVAGKYAGALGTDYPIYNNQDYAFQASGDGVPNQGDFDAAQAPTTFNPVGTYMKTLDLSADDITDNRLILSFLGVESGFYLYVNGAVVGYGEDSFSTSEFDVTDYVHEGENLLTVQVFRWTTGSFLENQDGLNYGGINRDVLLTVQPDVAVYDYDVETTFADHDYSTSTLAVDVDLANTSAAAATRSVEAHLFDADGAEVATTASDPVTVAPDADGTASLSTTVTAPKLWSAEIPNLYTLVLALKDGDGATVQTIGKRVGFREIYMANAGTTNSTSNMRVNGQNIELYGVNRGEVDPAYGHHVPYETVVKDVQNAKQLNINAIRTSHYPPDPHLIDLADEYGLYIMDEVNVESHNGRDGVNNTPFSIDPTLTSRDFPGNDSRYTASMKQRMTSMVMRDKSAPSVIMYSLGNEAGTGPNFDTMIDVIKDLDAEKLIHYQGDNGNPRVDMVGSFYPEYSAANRPTNAKPFILSEYQHSMGNTGGELDRYVDIIESSYRQQGGFIWDYVDQSAYTLEAGADTSDGVQDDELFLGFDGSWKQASGDGNFLQNGFIYPDRTWKPEAYEVKKQYQDLKFTQSAAQREDHAVTIVNLNRFKNANSYDVVWQLQEDGTTVQSGTLSDEQADLAAPTGNIDKGSSKSVTIPYGIDDPKAGAEYQLLLEYRLAADTAYADAGYVQGSAQFAIDTKGADRVVDVEALAGSTTTDSAKAVTVTGTTPAGAPFTVAIDKTTGLMGTYEVDGKDLVTKAPVGSFFRAETDQSAAVNGNAHTLNAPEAYQGWVDQGENLQDVRVSTLQGLGDTTKVVVNATLRNGSAWTTTYTVYADGTVAVGATLAPSASAPDQLGEFGMMMQLPSDLENMEWYGRGPSETYWDRKAGNNVGVWSSTVDEQFFPYMRIQETGNKTDVRWVALTDDDGAGLLASMDYGTGYGGDPLEVTALHYTPKALSSYNSKKLYPYQAERTDDVVLRVLKHQKGVGNITWGSEPPSAVIGKNDAEQLTYDYVLRPIAAGSDPMSASKDIYPAPSFPLLDSVTIDDMPLTGFSPETFEYDYTLPDYYPSALVPEVAATAPEGTTVTIDQPTAVPGTAVLHVSSGSSTVDYTVRIAAGATPSPVVSVPDVIDVPATVSASGAYTGATAGAGKLLYAYSGYGRIGENISTTGAGLQTASGLYAKGFQGNAEQILDVDISDLDARSFSGVGGIDPSKWTGTGATRSSIIFEVWAHKDVSQLTSAYYAPMAPGAAGTGTIVTTGWTKLSASAVMTGKKDTAFSGVPLTYVENGVTKHYQALRLVMNANGDNGHDQGVWGDPRVTRDLPEDPQLHAVTLDGATLPGFAADDHEYTVVLGSAAKVPAVGADADQGIFVNVTQATGIPGTAKVRAGTELYTVTFERAEAPADQQAYVGDLVSAPASLSGDGEDRSSVLNGNLLYAYSGSGPLLLDRSEGVGDDTTLRLRASGSGDDAVVREYEHGVAGRAQQVLDVDVSHRDALRFTADVGVDWTTQPDGSGTDGDGPAVRFEVWGTNDASKLTNGYYAATDLTPTGGTLPTAGWVRLGASPVMANADYSGDLEVRQDLYRFDLDLTDEDGNPYEALRLVAVPADGSSPVQSVWGDPQVTFAGDTTDEPVDVIRLTSDVDESTATVGYLLSTEQDGTKVRSIAAVYDADNRMLGSQEVTFATNDGNQDGDLPIALPEGSDPTSVAYLLVEDGTLTPVAGAWRKGATATGAFSHTPLRTVLPATGPTLDVAFDAGTHDVTLTGSGYSPGSVLVVEGNASGVSGLDHVAFVTADGRGVLDYTYRSGATTADSVSVRVGGQGFDEILARPLVASVEITGDGVVDGKAALAVGGRLDLTADVQPETAADRSVTWSSSDESVATVVDGAVEAVTEGTATITATATDGSGVSGSVRVTVLAPTWSSTTSYVAGDRVEVDGVVYVALWSTRGQEPGSSATGAWAEVGATVACTAGDHQAWTASAVYVKGDTVVHDGTVWTAQWWTRDQAPGDPSGPWTSAGACNSSGASVVPPWAASAIYTGGEIVSHTGHRWEAQWWNRNQEPSAGAWGAWKDLGAL